MDADYSKMTDEDFEMCLESIVSKMTAASILSYGNVRAELGEALNNDVLDMWARENRALAYPEPEAETEQE